MRAQCRRAGGVALALVLLTLASAHASSPIDTVGDASIDDPARMHLAAEYLARVQDASGFFPYDVDLTTGASTETSDMSGVNLVRQADAAFALSRHFRHYPSERARATLIAVLEAMARQSLPIGRGSVQRVLEDVGVYNRWRLWRVARRPLHSLGLLYVPHGPGDVVSAHGEYERAYSGATALALIVELNFHAATGDDRFAEMRRRWLDGLLTLHVPGRGFREAPHSLGESSYVNGQSWLALGRYLQQFPEDTRVAGVLSEIDDYMLARYGERPSAFFFHWGAMAAALRAHTTGDARFVAFIERQVAWYLSTQGKKVFELPDNRCFLVEGLSAAALAMHTAPRADDELMQRAVARMRQVMQDSRALQVLGGTSAHAQAHAGAFLSARDATTTQIDMTGHCLSALVGVDRYRAGIASLR